MDYQSELKKIYSAAVLACVLVVLFLFIEPPITILAWVLVVTASLLVLYLAIASRSLFKEIQKEKEVTSK
ncbi:MAG: hypothetical protein HY276_02450 [Ignavibacteriales bacterium]|nr:hypothetical protein [Ignavibacteriales bacterium]